MASPAAVLSILVQANGTAATTGALQGVQRELQATDAHVNRMGVSWEQAGQRMAKVGQNMSRLGQQWNRTVTLPIVAGTALAIKATMDFESALTQVETQAGASGREIAKMRGEILKLGPAVGQTPTALANALFHIESSGIRGAKALSILRDSARLAAIGHSDLEKTTNAVVAVMKTAPKDIKNTTDAIGTMNAIVGAGNMRMEDLAGALSTGVLPAAKAVGLGMRDVGAALDVMTSRGVPAQDAATRLRMTFSLLAAPTTKAIAQFKTIGLSQNQLANDMRKPGGLVIAIKDLRDHLQSAGLTAVQQNQVISRAFGGGRSSSAILTLVQNAGDLQKAFDQIGKHNGAPEVNKAWNKTRHDLGFQWDQMKAEAQAAAIEIGHAIGPSVLQFGKTVLHDATAIAGAFSKLPAGLQHTIITGGLIVAAIGPALRIAGVFTTGIGRLYDAALLISRMARTGTFASATSGLANRAGAAGPTIAGGAATEGAAATSVMGRVGTLAVKALGVAGIAAFAAPLVIGLGEALHKWIGDSAEKEGQRFASQFLAPMPAAIRSTFHDALAQSSVDLSAALTRRQTGGQKGGHPVPVGMLPAAVTNANDQAVQKAYFNQGFLAARAVVAGLKSVKDVSTPVVLQDFLSKLKQLPAQARPEAAKAMIQYALGLQQSGKLPKSAFAEILSGITRQFPQLNIDLQRAGLKTARDFATTLKFHEATATLRNTLRGYRTQFGDWAIATKLTEGNINDNASMAMKHLHNIITNSSGQTRKDAVAELKQMQQQINHTFDAMVSKVISRSVDLKGGIAANTKGAATAAATNFDNLQNSILTAMKNGVVTTAKGSAMIATALNATLKSFGAKEIPFPTGLKALNNPNLSVGVPQGSGTSTAGHQHRATGGMVQFGKSGGKGRDNIPVNFGGVPVMVGSGEMGMVLTGQQQQVANAMMAPIGGLPGLFQHVNQPNYMAKGGPVKGFASGGVVESYGQLEDLWIKAGGPRNMAALMAAIAEAESGGLSTNTNPSGASGLWQILGVPFPGNVFDPLTNARMAVAKFRSQGLGAWAAYTNGSYRQFLNGNVPASAFAGGAAPQISAPKVEGTGTIAAMVQAGLGKVAAAANAKVAMMAPTGGGLAVGVPGGRIAGGGAGAYSAVLPVSRTDQGLDFTGAGPIGAILDGTVIRNTLWQGWPGTGGVVYRTAKGNVYDMEHVQPVVSVGQHVRAGQHIANVLPGYPWLETGWANSAGTGPLTPYNGAPDGTAMPGGVAFRRYLGYLRGGFIRASRGYKGPKAASFDPAKSPTVKSAFGPGHWPKGHKGSHSSTAGHAATLASMIGEPGLPHLPGRAHGTADYVSGTGRTLSGMRTHIDQLEHAYSTLQGFYGTTPTGAQENVLINYRQQVFDTWGDVVVLTSRLASGYQMLLGNLNSQQKGISTKGLKGKKLAAANSQRTKLGTSISKYRGKLTSTRGDLLSAGNSRDDAWISLVQEKALPGSTAATSTTQDQSAALLSQLLQQSQQALAVSQAQYKVFQNATGSGLVGSFASGGMWPQTGWGLVGERGPELAHLPVGTRIYNANQTSKMSEQPIIQVIVKDGAVDPNKIEVIAEGAAVKVMSGRQAAVRTLPGRGGGRIR